MPPWAHALTGVTDPEPAGELRLDEPIRRPEPRVLNPAIIVFGFGAVGRDGNMSSVWRGGATFDLLEVPTRAAVVGGGRGVGAAAPMVVLLTCGADVLAQTACDVGAALLLGRPFAPASAGNGSRLEPPGRALPHDPCFETADRDDCAVLFFRVRTRRPPVAPAPALDTPGSVPLGPGRLG